MTRKASEKSNSGIYHILIRGINQQSIFEDDKDESMFCEIERNESNVRFLPIARI